MNGEGIPRRDFLKKVALGSAALALSSCAVPVEERKEVVIPTIDLEELTAHPALYEGIKFRTYGYPEYVDRDTYSFLIGTTQIGGNTIPLWSTQTRDIYRLHTSTEINSQSIEFSSRSGSFFVVAPIVFPAKDYLPDTPYEVVGSIRRGNNENSGSESYILDVGSISEVEK